MALAAVYIVYSFSIFKSKNDYEMGKNVNSYKYGKYTSAFSHVCLTIIVLKALQYTSNLSQYCKDIIYHVTGLVGKLETKGGTIWV